MIKFPASPNQHQLWLIHQFDPDSPAYNVPSTFRIRGELDKTALAQSFQAIVDRHEILRTQFSIDDGHLAQVVLPDIRFDLPTESLPVGPDDHPTGSEDERIKRWCKDVITTPFDLASAPLLRAKLLRVAEADHVLELVVHHIVVDQRSIAVLSRELETLYAAARSGQASTLPPPEIEYGDFVVWQRDWLDDATRSAKRAFWQDSLAGHSGLLRLPSDRPRGVQPGFPGAELAVAVPADVVAKLKELGRQQGASLFATMLAAWQVLLARYGRQDDVIVATPFENREQAELEDVVGFFVNTLPIATDLSDRPSMRELIGRLRSAVLRVLGNQDSPFEVILEAVQPKRDPSYNPIFQHSFLLQDPPMQIGLDGTRVESIWVNNGCSKFDTTAWLWEAGDGTVAGELEYNSQLFDRATIERLWQSYLCLLQSAVASPDTPVNDLPLLGEAERRRLITEWNDTGVDYGRDECLHEWFERAAAERPDAVAVEAQAETLTYAALNERANRIAHHLRGLGVGPEGLCGVCVQRGLNLPAAMLGVLKAGAAYVPLDPGYPTNRLAFMAEDAAIDVLLADDNSVGQVELPGARVVNLDRDTALLAQQDVTNPRTKTRAGDLAYVIYTSGSSGRPKGVMIQHDAIVNQLRWVCDTLDLGPADRTLQKTPVSFDASVWELFAPLLSGGRLVMAKPDGHQDNAYLVQATQEHAITVLQVVPTMLQLLLATPGLDACASLRHVIAGGETLAACLAEEFTTRCSAQLHNFYGPTEATIDAAAHTVSSSSLARSTVPIGRPVANTQVYILDDDQQLVAPGMVGEICIGGVQVARGYVNQPSLTSERFVPDTISGAEDGRLYRTGDNARWLENGEIEYLDRLDTQIKLRGLRIELGEIEAVIAEHDAVSRAAASIREAAPGDQRLVVHYVANEAAFVSTAQLRKHLRRALPDYMIPQHLIEVDAIPTTPSGKIDRNALPAPVDAAAQEADHVAPESDLERALAGIWSAVLGIETISAHDNFFDIGGHSLLAVKVVSQAKEQLGIQLPIRLVVSDSLRQIAGAMDG